MTYAAKQDLIDRYGEQELILLTDRVNAPPAAVDDTVLTQKLEDADAKINSFISGRYTTPVSPVPRALLNCACVLTRYYLHGDNIPSYVKDALDDEIAWLKGVAAGTNSLGDNVTAPTDTSSGGPQASAPCRTFTGDTLRPFTRDVPPGEWGR